MEKIEEALKFAEKNMALHAGDADSTEMLRWFNMLQMIRKIQKEFSKKC